MAQLNPSVDTYHYRQVILNTTPQPEINKIPPPPYELAASPALRWGLFILGWIMIALGIVGVLVPGMPTTVFLIAAIWAFSRSSERFQKWLWEHRIMGPSIRAWYQYRVIPLRGKILAVGVMSASIVYLAILYDGDWMPPALLSGVLLPVGLYICTRSSNPPLNTKNGLERVDEW